ncbi:MAG: hypothetical protein ACK4TN_06910 [Brevinematales bacterium]
MKKKSVFIMCLLVFLGCTSKTKAPSFQQFLFTKEAIGIDLIPELAEMNLRLTIGLIRDGFLVVKKDETVTIKQISTTELSPEEQNQVKTKLIGKWYVATLPLKTLVHLPSPPQKSFEIKKWLSAHKIKASPVLMVLSEGLKENLSTLSNYTAKGYLETIDYKISTNDIQITLKVVLIPYAGK